MADGRLCASQIHFLRGRRVQTITFIENLETKDFLQESSLREKKACSWWTFFGCNQPAQPTRPQVYHGSYEEHKSRTVEQYFITGLIIHYVFQSNFLPSVCQGSQLFFRFHSKCGIKLGKHQTVINRFILEGFMYKKRYFYRKNLI